jgi:hypothetical protein
LARQFRGARQRGVNGERNVNGVGKQIASLRMQTGGMENPKAKPFDYRLMAIGAAAMAGGIYFIFVGFGLLPSPGRINGPLWLSIGCGLVFLLGGVSVSLRGYLRMDDSQTDIPADAPHWVKLVWWGNTVAICCALASIGSWIAFGGGTRHFSVAGLINGSVGESIGRAAFGLGAILAWLIAAVFARAGWRKVFGK